MSFVFEVNRVRFQYQAFGSNSFCLILSLSKRNSAFYVVDLGFSYYFVGALRHRTILHQTVTETMKYSFWSMLSSLNSRHVSYSFFHFSRYIYELPFPCFGNIDRKNLLWNCYLFWVFDCGCILLERPTIHCILINAHAGLPNERPSDRKRRHIIYLW